MSPIIAPSGQSGGGSNPGGLAIYGDGSDGPIVVNANGFTYPSLGGVPDWQANTAYALGDIVKSTTTYVRAYRCIIAGTSGATDPFGAAGIVGTDNPPGTQFRGFRVGDEALDGQVEWEQVTSVLSGVLEGPLFVTDLTVDNGVLLNCWGWAIFATGTVTINGELSSSGPSATGATAPTWPDFGSPICATLMGAACLPAPSNTPGNFGNVWGGGAGGRGGAGADNPTGLDSFVGGLGSGVSFTLARKSILTLFNSFFKSIDSGSAFIGSSGGGGSDDTGAGKKGGASGIPGSGLAVFAKTLTGAGSITADGGNGADGEAGGDTGGGGGASGGCIVVTYNALTGTLTLSNAGGTGGAGQGAGTAGGDGSPGDIVQNANA